MEEPSAGPNKTTLALRDGTEVDIKIKFDTGKQKLVYLCDLCGESFAKPSNNSLSRVEIHRDSQRCKDKRKIRDGPRAVEGRIIAEEQRRIIELATGQSRNFNPASRSLKSITEVREDLISESISMSTSSGLTLSAQASSSEHSRTLVPANDVEAEEVFVCKGIKVRWAAGSVWSTYPYHRHDSEHLGWIPEEIYPKSEQLVLRSEKCAIYDEYSTQTRVKNGVCDPCARIPNSTRFRQLQIKSIHAETHTPWQYLNVIQIRDIAHTLATKNRALSIENISLKRDILHLKVKVDDHERITVLIASKNFAGLRYLLASMVKQGVNPTAILRRLERATGELCVDVNGRWTDREYDLAWLSKHIGGNKILYALSKSEGWPSDRTLRRHRPLITLTACIMSPDKDVFLKNLSGFLKMVAISNPSSPMQLMIDDVALDERVRYDAKRNSVLGFCREHSDSFDLSINNLASIEHLGC